MTCPSLQADFVVSSQQKCRKLLFECGDNFVLEHLKFHNISRPNHLHVREICYRVGKLSRHVAEGSQKLQKKMPREGG